MRSHLTLHRIPAAGLGYFAYMRRHTLFPGGSGGGNTFERFDKAEGLDGASAMGGGNASARATNIYASTGGPKFGGGGRMVRSLLRAQTSSATEASGAGQGSRAQSCMHHTGRHSCH